MQSYKSFPLPQLNTSGKGLELLKILNLFQMRIKLIKKEISDLHKG